MGLSETCDSFMATGHVQFQQYEFLATLYDL